MFKILFRILNNNYGFIGSIIESAHDARMQPIIDKQNRKAEDRAWARQIAFARSAHQYEVEDLKAAGLHPNLSAGGSGASVSAPHVAQAYVPQVSTDDIMSGIVSLKQLEQADRRLDIDESVAKAGIAKNLTEQEINKMKQKLMQKGMPRAQLEGQISEVMDKMIKYFRNSTDNPKVPKQDNKPNMDIFPFP